MPGTEDETLSFDEQTSQGSPSSSSNWTPQSAYEQTRCELAAVPQRQLLVINLDIPTTVRKILSLLPELRAVSAAMDVRWRQPDATRLERLERYAWAALYAHARWVASRAAPGPDIASVAGELRKLRRNIVRCLQGLVAARLVSAEEVNRYRYGKSHWDLAITTSGLILVCTVHWSEIADKTPLSEEELARAQQLVDQLSLLLHTSQQRPVPLVDAERECRQAFTLLLNEYKDLQRAARFLYRKTEATQRVPSLFRKRPRARSVEACPPQLAGS